MSTTSNDIMQLQKDIAALRAYNSLSRKYIYNSNPPVSNTRKGDNNQYQNNTPHYFSYQPISSPIGMDIPTKKAMINNILNDSQQKTMNYNNKNKPNEYMNPPKRNSIDYDEEEDLNILSKKQFNYANSNNPHVVSSNMSIDLTRFKIEINSNNTQANTPFGNGKVASNFLDDFNGSNMSPVNNNDTNDNKQLPPKLIQENNNPKRQILPLSNSNSNNNSNTNFNNSVIDNNTHTNTNGNKLKAKKSNEEELVSNISVTAANYKFIMYNKQLREEALRKKINDENANKQQSDNPSSYTVGDYNRLFAKTPQSSSRRMIVEMSKLLLKNKPSKQTITEYLEMNSINPITIASVESLEQNAQNRNIRGSNLTLGDQVENRIQQREKIVGNLPRGNHMEDMKYLDKFLNKMNDHSQEKMTMLNFITIPRLMNMIIAPDQCIPYIFLLTPCSFGVENYAFIWKDCRSYTQVNGFNLLNVNSCMINHDYKNEIEIVVNNEQMEIVTYYIEAYDEDIAKMYAESINFLSQFVKCKAFSCKRNNMNISSGNESGSVSKKQKKGKSLSMSMNCGSHTKL